MQRLSAGYERLLGWSLAHRKTVLAIAAASFLAAFPLMKFLGSEFVPEPDLSELKVQFKTPVGSSLELTTQKARQAEAALREFPEVKYTYTTVNTGFVQGKNRVNIFVQLVPRKGRALSQNELTRPMRERLSRIAGIEIQQIGAYKTVSSGKPLQISILGQERKMLAGIAEQVMAATREVAGAVDMLYDKLFLHEDPAAELERKRYEEVLNPESLVVLTGCQVEPALADVTPNEPLQFLRQGYFCRDRVDGTGDRLVFNRTVTLRDTWAKIEKTT